MTLLRDQILSLMLTAGASFVVSEAQRRFALFLEDPEKNAIPGHLRALVYTAVVTHGAEKEYDAVLDIYRKSDLQQEKRRCMMALGKSKLSELQKRTLEWALSEEVRPSEAVSPLCSVAATPQGAQLAWDFVQNRWEELLVKFSGGIKNLLAYVIKTIASRFTAVEKADEIVQFFKSHPFPAGNKAIEQSIETVHSNSKMLKEQQEPLGEWLKENAA